MPVLFLSSLAACQAQEKLALNQDYKDIQLSRKSFHTYELTLAKDGIYRFSILQQGIAVYYSLTTTDNKKVYECNYPDDISGYEKFEYTPEYTGTFLLNIRRYDDPENTDSGSITLTVKSLSKAEIEVRKQIRKELEPENKKNVTTIDIDHFWTAYDNLKNCKSFSDSVNCFQKFYLDKATNGLLDFVQVRDFTPEKFVNAVSQNSAFYQSIRRNTLVAKQAESVVEEVFAKFKILYPDFKPFKVCFAIGIKNTGGTVSNQFVLIGTEVTTAMSASDSFNSDAIVERIRGIVAHECVHTQQIQADHAAIQCPLLYQSIKEGACDFIAELINGKKHEDGYGEKNEARLWTEFKNELCNQNTGNWLYNGSTVKDKPGDLGYFIGYAICKEYYENTADKKQAVVDIIGMTDAIRFLELSRYDQKFRK